MGAIQGAADKLASTALGAAVAGKHLKQQGEQVKEAEASKKLAGINAAAVTSSQLAENVSEYEKAIGEERAAGSQHIKDYHELYKQEDIRNKVTTDEKGRMRTEGGQFYSEKQLKAAITAERSSRMALEAARENKNRIIGQRELLLHKAEAIDELYGEKVVDIPSKIISRDQRMTKANETLMQKRSEKSNAALEGMTSQERAAAEKVLENEKKAHPYTMGGKK